MRSNLILWIVALMLGSCAKNQHYEREWIEKDNENMLLTIDKEHGKIWLHGVDIPYDFVQDGPESYMQIRDQKVAFYLDTDQDILRIKRTIYIPVSKSKKGQFIGRWKSELGDTIFDIQLDDNVDLTWDIRMGTDKPIRFYPKRTDTGFYFTSGQETLSYRFEDGVIIDANDVKYVKETAIMAN